MQAILFTQYPQLFELLESSPSTIFVPTNDAVTSLFEFGGRPISPDTAPSLIASQIIDVFERLSNLSSSSSIPGFPSLTDLPSIPSLPELIRYHIIPQNLSESQLVEASPVQPLLGPPLDLSNYPTDIQDEDPMQRASRLARQIATPSGRVVIITSILLPFNVQDILLQLGVLISGPPSPPLTLFDPLRSLLKFLSARNDLVVLRALIAQSSTLLALLSSPGSRLYLFAPNDYAFLRLVQTLLPETFIPAVLGDVDTAIFNVSRASLALQAGNKIDIENAIGNSTKIRQFASRLEAVWANLENVPTLDELVLYHVINTSSSCEELAASGPQPTLFTNRDNPVTEITVTKQGVEDLSERQPANTVANLATRNGFVTVLDSVLLPFSIEEWREIIAGDLGAPFPTPFEDVPMETAGAAESPVAQPTGSADGEVVPTMASSPLPDPSVEETPGFGSATPSPGESVPLETAEAVESSVLQPTGQPDSADVPVVTATPSLVTSSPGLGAETSPPVEEGAQNTPGAVQSPLSQPTGQPGDDTVPTETASDDGPVCFPSSSSIKLIDGSYIRMDELEAGVHVHVGSGVTSKVFLFTHKQPNVTSTFIRIYTKSGHRISLTPGHYLYANGRLTAAMAVKAGDFLDADDGLTTVVKTERTLLHGLYAPHTIHGDIIVDGIRVSGYSAALHPVVAQALLAPLRYLASRGLSEPLGSLFYGGADRIAKILPRGSIQY